MDAPGLSIDDLRQLLFECAGADEEVDLDGDILEVPFEELGYDSLALLNTVARIERDYSVKLGDDVITDAKTPRLMLERVNGALSGRSGLG